MPALPVLARAALHFGEEPCISGTKGSGTVFFSGCNLRCVFCQNEQISAGGFGRPVTVRRLREIFCELSALGAHNINLVTPTHFTEPILEALQEKTPVPVVWNSGGYESVDTLKRLEGKVQVFLPDFKYAEETPARELSDAADYPAIAEAAICEMVRQTGTYVIEDGLLKRGVLIRHLLLPGRLGNTKRVIDRVAARFPPGTVLFSLMCQYVPVGRAEKIAGLNRRVTGAEYRAAVDYMLSCGITDGYVQERDSAETEFIPAFDLTGV
jgi:putative pyruvate formate lyase activating enzyme